MEQNGFVSLLIGKQLYRHWRPNSSFPRFTKSKKPFTLSLWFDKLTMIGLDPFVLSLSKDKPSTNGLCEQHWVRGDHERICLLNYGLLSKPEHLELLPDMWLRTVKLVGETVIEPGGERTLSVESILPLDGEIEETAVTAEGFPFWSSLSLEELAEQQKVLPVEDLDAISAFSLVDDDPDKLMDHILSERSARRRISGGGLS